MILKKTLHSAIGRYSSTLDVVVIFGINLTKVLFIDDGRYPVMKNSWISLVTAFPTVFQLDWKKLAENPSGPGALSG